MEFVFVSTAISLISNGEWWVVGLWRGLCQCPSYLVSSSDAWTVKNYYSAN